MKNRFFIRMAASSDKVLATVAVATAVACSGCGRKASGGELPANFDAIGDAGRVEYVMQNSTPDSVARFIIYGALGRNQHGRIDSLAIATNYAYENLKDKDLETFSITYDSIVEALPLADKMKVYSLAGAEDPQGLGYRLGLEYMSSIRDHNKTAADVRAELEAFRKVCAADTAMYRRFMIGFRTVLKVDHGKDVPEDIYKQFAE